MSRLVITEAATADIAEICDFIGADSSEQADRIMDSFYAEIGRIGTWPGIGHRRVDLGSNRDALFWTFGRYYILYRHTTDETVILAVLHGSRDIPAVLREREGED